MKTLIEQEIYNILNEKPKEFTGKTHKPKYKVVYHGSLGNIKGVTVTHLKTKQSKTVKPIPAGKTKEQVRDDLKRQFEVEQKPNDDSAEMDAVKAMKFDSNFMKLMRENQQGSKIIQEYILKNTPQPPKEVSVIEIIADEVNKTLNNLPEVQLASEILSEDELKKLFAPLAKEIVMSVYGQVSEKIILEEPKEVTTSDGGTTTIDTDKLDPVTRMRVYKLLIQNANPDYDPGTSQELENPLTDIETREFNSYLEALENDQRTRELTSLESTFLAQTGILGSPEEELAAAADEEEPKDPQDTDFNVEEDD